MSEGGILKAVAPVTIDGREYLLRYRAYAFIRYSEDLQRDLMADINEIGPILSTGQFGPIFGKLRDLIWAGLIDVQPEITREDVARMLDVQSMQGVLEAALEAIKLSMPAETPTQNPTNGRHRAQRSRPIDGVKSGPLLDAGVELRPANSNV